jgi:myosin XV
LLSFKKDDIIKLISNSYTPDGWFRGEINNKQGLFPKEYVQSIDRLKIKHRLQPPIELIEHESDLNVNKVQNTSSTQLISNKDGHFSMMEFAMIHFKQSIDKIAQLDKNFKHKMSQLSKDVIIQKIKELHLKHNNEWTWNEYANMIKFTKTPIQSSLLKLENSNLALNCFIGNITTHLIFFFNF